MFNSSTRKISLVFFAIWCSINAFTPGEKTDTESNPSSYNRLIQQINSSKLYYSNLYSYSASDSSRTQLLHQASLMFTHVVADSILPYWEGTKWSYGGMTNTPQKGSIACGYFVTTILKDAGLKIDRIKAGQMGAIDLIYKLVDEKNVGRNYRMSMDQLKSYLIQQGEGIYLLGLDEHIGFIICYKNEMKFVHASKLQPACVKTEQLMKSRSVIDSKYKVTAALSKDHTFIENWIQSKDVNL